MTGDTTGHQRVGPFVDRRRTLNLVEEYEVFNDFPDKDISLFLCHKHHYEAKELFLWFLFLCMTIQRCNANEHILLDS